MRISVLSFALLGTVLVQPVFAQTEIDETVVYGQQIISETETGSRLGLTQLETPATVDIIIGDSLRAHIETTVLGAVTRSAGFTNEANPGNGGQSIAARGFRGQGTVTKLYDGSNYYTAAGTITFPFDTWGVERIEVLKGPSSVLYGEGGIGGAINVIPKTPKYEAERELRLTAGENGTLGLGVGLAGGLSENVAYRLDYSRQESDGWVNDGASESQMLSGSLLWDVSSDLALTARFDYGDQSPMKYFGTPLLNGDFNDDLIEANFNVGDAEVSYQDKSIRLKADWIISNDLSMQAEIFQLSANRLWKNSEFYEFDVATELVTRRDPLVIGHDMDHNGFRTNFVLANDLAGFDVRSSLGLEINNISFSRPSNFGPNNPDPIDWENDVDVADLNAYAPGTLSDLTDAPVVLDNVSDVSQAAIFGEAQVHLNDQWSLLGGLRVEKIDTDYHRLGQTPIDQSVNPVTGRIGAVYDFSENAALYGQYSTGATHPSNSVVTASASNRDSDVIKTEQFEIGVKQAGLNGRLQWSLAYFDITKNNLIEDDPDSADPADLIEIDEQTSQGIELSYNLNLGSSVQTYGNMVVLNAETDTGDTPNFVPEKTFNLGVVVAAGEDIRIYADLRHVGERFHPSHPIPSYTVVDASIAYQVNSDLALTLKADNLLDKLYASAAYYSSTWLVGQPRTLSLTADFSF
jgi:iron complex outermembrane receptor protein